VRKTGWYLAAAVAAGAGLIAAGVLPSDVAPPPSAATPVTVRISAGGTTARGLISLGEALAAEYAKVLPDVRFVVLPSAGSGENLQNLQQGEADLAFAQADLAYLGYHGRLPGAPERSTDVRGIAVMHPAVVHLIRREGLPIHSIHDLRGRRVGVGPSDSATRFTSGLLLNFLGHHGEQAWFSAPAPQPINRMIRGEIDATFAVSASPNDEVRRAVRAGGRLVEISGPDVERFRAEHPFVRAGVIPGGMYAGHPRPIRTLAVDVLFLARAGLDQALVQRLTRAFFEVLPRVAAQVEFVRTMDPNRAPATPVPLHRGAALYYRERELSR
jgi:TRAP transporter TAXI family solute receptor